jgi:hypothetical protein
MSAPPTVAVFGGTGFLGRNIVASRVIARLVLRNREGARHAVRGGHGDHGESSMSGPKVVRIVTREEILGICHGQLARVDAALAEWTRKGRRNSCRTCGSCYVQLIADAGQPPDVAIRRSWDISPQGQGRPVGQRGIFR